MEQEKQTTTLSPFPKAKLFDGRLNKTKIEFAFENSEKFVWLSGFLRAVVPGTTANQLQITITTSCIVGILGGLNDM